MNTEGVKKFKPSGLRPPQVKVAENLRGASRTLFRRSKSVADLQHFANKDDLNFKVPSKGPQTRLQKLQPLSVNSTLNVVPTTSKMPETQLQKLQPSSENVTGNMGPTSSVRHVKVLTRRSKTAASLRSTAVKAKAPLGATNAVKQNPPLKKLPVKRKTDSPNDEVKPKVKKLPCWDYKGRYHQLLERHGVLNEEFKKQQGKVEEFNVLEEKYNITKNEYDVLEKRYITLTDKNAHTETENIKLKKELSELTNEAQIIAEEYAKSKKKVETLQLENDGLLKDNEKFTKEIKILNDDLLNLREAHAQLKHDQEQLLNDHRSLTIQTENALKDNEELKFNLNLKTNTVTGLLDQISFLKDQVNSGAILRRQLHNAVQDLKGNIRVFCRVRPPIGTEEMDRPVCSINFIDEKTLEIRRSRESISTISGKPTDVKAEFTVDKIFEPKSSQEEVFEDLSQLVQSALDGYDVCVFAYGQTGSGKTYTMQGEESPEQRGMIPRTVDLIFNSIETLEKSGWNYNVSASFLEIYNENVRDLLNPNPNQNLEIRFNEGRGTTVMNLTVAKLSSPQELKDLMLTAQRNRAVAATDFNEHSSRSHAVTRIYLQGTNEERSVMYSGSINLVDLAGSESAKTSSSERLTETKNINKSLSALESVMLALYNKEKHIPYRNSKLTYLLQSSLGGSSKTLMVVNIAPFEECYMESVYSLRFAAKVKEVKMTLKRNKANYCQPQMGTKA